MNDRSIDARPGTSLATLRPLALAAVLALGAPLALGTTACGTLTNEGDGDMKKKDKDKKDKDGNRIGERAATGATGGFVVEPTPFAERNGDDVFNASGIVALGDSTFLFCDNNANDALFELALDAEGRQRGPIVRRPLGGLPPGAIDDLEGMALAEANGRRYVFATTSMSVRTKKGRTDVPPSGILRVRIGEDGALTAETMPGAREWMLGAFPQLAGAGEAEPDDGGLNIEGLAWDPRSSTLFFGVRTPVPGGRPLVLPVRVKDLAGPWTPANLEAGMPAAIAMGSTGDEAGIRDLAFDPVRGGFLVVTGNSTSKSKAGFAIHAWSPTGDVATRRLDVAFPKKVKVEGITRGTVGGRGAHVLVDDGGGFAVLWDDTPALRD